MVSAEQDDLKKPKKSEMPKGGRKGGTIFPRISLEQALVYSKKVVSKTAIAAQPEATILAGVFDNVGSNGKIRLSALKQFGLIEGTAAGYKGTQLARDIEAAADAGEKLILVRRALLTSKVFRELYNTYQDDQTTKGKIRGRTQQLGVHPDASDACTDFFVSSALTAVLATVEGDGIRLVAATEVTNGPKGDPLEDEIHEPDSLEEDDSGEIKGTLDPATPGTKNNGEKAGTITPRPRTAADVTLNLTIDSSLDGDKLEKQLVLLRRYGLI